MGQMYVNGENENPLFTYIKSQKTEDVIEGMKNKLSMKAIEKSTTAKKTEDMEEDIKKLI